MLIIRIRNCRLIIGGIDYATGMKRIHAVILPNCEVISGVRVFKEAYDRVGMGWLYSCTNIPWLARQLEYAYEFWAKYRTLLTRGEHLDSIIGRRNQLLKAKMELNSKICIDDRCNK